MPKGVEDKKRQLSLVSHWGSLCNLALSSLARLGRGGGGLKEGGRGSLTGPLPTYSKRRRPPRVRPCMCVSKSCTTVLGGGGGSGPAAAPEAKRDPFRAPASQGSAFFPPAVTGMREAFKTTPNQPIAAASSPSPEPTHRHHLWGCRSQARPPPPL